MDRSFDYQSAFSRNIGWITEIEQVFLRTRRIAIAGLGGVGGSHLLTLTRLGIGNFNISDPDQFELANFNRQAGASLSHIGRPKVKVLEELAKDINPELELRTFPDGIGRDNLDQFLDGVDLYVDGLDFFVLDIRRALFAACAEKSIPAITAAPLGMGVALLNFLPGKMTFEQYFQLEGQSEDEQQLRFLLGLSPSMLQMPYLVDYSQVDLANQKGPSTPMACELSAGMAATHALKILLNRGKVPAAPWGVHFDAFRNRLSNTWRPGGNSNPMQKLGLMIARKRLSAKLASTPATVDETQPETPIERILELARWAPSGDNTQPWRFEIIDETSLLVHASDTRDWCVYDLDGRASQIAVGTLLENIAIAASAEGLDTSFNRRKETPETKPVIEVSFTAVKKQEPDPLLPYIKIRSVQRRPYSTRPLSSSQKDALEASVDKRYRIIWIEGRENKWRMAKLLFRNAHIRLTMREGYEVHRDVIEWDAQFSKDKVPDKSVGLDPVTLRLMKWAMQTWERVQMLNRWFAGTFIPRIQLDLIPALRCGAHFVIVAEQPPKTIDDNFDSGRALQRFWLTATRLGLQFQPEVTPLIFSTYEQQGKHFTKNEKALHEASILTQDLDDLIGKESNRCAVYMGRMGTGPFPSARSLRLPLTTLKQT